MKHKLNPVMDAQLNRNRRMNRHRRNLSDGGHIGEDVSWIPRNYFRQFIGCFPFTVRISRPAQPAVLFHVRRLPEHRGAPGGRPPGPGLRPPGARQLPVLPGQHGLGRPPGHGHRRGLRRPRGYGWAGELTGKSQVCGWMSEACCQHVVNIALSSNKFIT